MATNEIQNGCESSIEAVLPSNHKRRCVLTAKHPELGAGFGTKNLGRQTKTHSAKRDAKRDTFKTRYSPVGIRICDLLPLEPIPKRPTRAIIGGAGERTWTRP